MTAPNPRAKRCGAKTRSGGTCQTWAMPNGRCRKHGGSTPSGPALPQFKLGRFSRHFPADVLAHATESASTVELASLREHILAIDLVLDDDFRRVAAGESGELWTQAEALFERFQRERARANVEGMAGTLAELGDTLKRGHASALARRELFEHMEARRKAAVHQLQYWKVSEHTVSAAQVVMMAKVLLDSVNRHAKELPWLRRAVTDDFVRALGFVPDAERALAIDVGSATGEA